MKLAPQTSMFQLSLRQLQCLAPITNSTSSSSPASGSVSPEAPKSGSFLRRMQGNGPAQHEAELETALTNIPPQQFVYVWAYYAYTDHQILANQLVDVGRQAACRPTEQREAVRRHGRTSSLSRLEIATAS